MPSFGAKYRHFLHPHYIGNLFLSLIFFALKTLEPFCSTLFDDCQLELREWELMTFMGCVIVMKNRKTPSYNLYIQTVCMFAKMLSAVLFIRQNPIYGALYIVACFLHLIFLPEPIYRGPEFVTYFRGPNLQNELDRDKRVTWLIEFYAAWAPNCGNFAPQFAELSAQFTLDNLKFGKIDVTRFPDVAKKFNIDISSWSKQLPTVILFQQGKEARRRPVVDTKGKLLAKFIFCKENVIRDFQLNELHLQCKKNPIPTNKRKDKQQQQQQQSEQLEQEQQQQQQQDADERLEDVDEPSNDSSVVEDQGGKLKSE